MRIIMAASIETDALRLIRLIIICLVVSIRTEAKIVDAMNTAVPISSGTSLLSRTNPVRARVMFVYSMPSSVTNSARTTKKITSSVSIQSLI